MPDIASIAEDDYILIEALAHKYNLTVEDFGKLLSKKQKNNLSLIIRLSSDEKNKLDAKRGNINRSKYCRLCYKKTLKENLYDHLDMLEVIKTDKDGRNEKVNITFDSLSEYQEMLDIARKLGVPFSSLMRYIALNIDLN